MLGQEPRWWSLMSPQPWMVAHSILWFYQIEAEDTCHGGWGEWPRLWMEWKKIFRERERERKRQEFTCGSLDAYYFQLNINHDINQHWTHSCHISGILGFKGIICSCLNGWNNLLFYNSGLNFMSLGVGVGAGGMNLWLFRRKLSHYEIESEEEVSVTWWIC